MKRSETIPHSYYDGPAPKRARIVPLNPTSLTRQEEIEQCRKRVRKSQFDLKLTADKKKEPNLKIAVAEQAIAEAERVYEEAKARADEAIQEQEAILEMLNDETKDKKRPFKTAIEQYAKADCRAFCSAFHKALSPELRGMVYEQLCPEYIDTNVHEFDTPNGHPTEDLYGWPSSYFNQHDDLPHYFDPEFSGDVATGLVTHIYRTKLHRFSSPSSLELMDRFLTTDIYHLGIVPGDVLQHIEINISKKNLESRFTRSSVIEGLQRLSKMKNKSAQVQLLIGHYDPLRVRAEHPLRGLIDFLEHVSPFLYKLRALGFIINLEWEYTPIKLGSYPRDDIHVMKTLFPKTLGEFMDKDIPSYRALDERWHTAYIRKREPDKP